MQAFRHENQKSFLQKKNGRNFSCRFLMWLGIAVETRLILELSMRVTRRKSISYTRHSSSFTKRNQLSPASFWLAVHPFFQERSSWIGLSIFVHKMAVERKGKLHDGIPVPELYIKNGKYK
ncbi:MAG: hypothetical protein DBY44_01705 [Veillonellaceae bacterium]|nr:MAG: hypothetical protein DBY44_01705 [Veillonellaceae bacterium]